MRIAVLSRGPQLYSTQSLIRAGYQRRHSMRIIDHTRCVPVLGHGKPFIWYDGYRMERFDAVIPRIGASVTATGATVINHFELMNTYSVIRSEALLQSRDKLRCLQKLAQHGLPIPATAAISDGAEMDYLVKTLGGFPIVIKLLESTHGMGVLLAENAQQLESITEAFLRLGERLILQEFIRESEGTDIRVLVVAGEVVASMKRQAQQGEFRSNLHRGGIGIPERLSEEEMDLAVKATSLMGLDVAGVDFLRSKKGPLILEVNASPGLEGIETITGIDVAGKVIEMIERKGEIG
ncbi:MAG TPA: RimK family alpha-L-glutamate ligase [Saprospiraceae bacterium]|nr:RimK family alpha-L-glutamate ligase [Saprospiraceae bacterium]HMQ81949.1 RimK family alpha-L-glutamate ligase [Saprospiraceae bacterium]